ncbi:DUF7151 family protein [Pyxidicoccus xibeiensis]|uniref:DUF7151 family protein n=1 Tax=Pyxidicoccus xibeiensis TaxID=2906759 RepID=UPI0020A73606|nr:hypothetical protein [Pyxidicoccus xibeiensis]MCP3139533.1 hypothetical protein [Pyxidicoccus xibeiensis]
MRWTWMVILALAAGCDGIGPKDLFKQHRSLTRDALEPAGEHCLQGGRKFESGLDENDNDQLDDLEVDETQTRYFCVSALSRRREEPAGSHCEKGGQAVQTGVDLDSSGTLEDGEVTHTDYVCATSVPGVLVRTRPVPPGTQCPMGGQVSEAGNDDNGNLLLEDDEIDSEAHGCTEVDPVLWRLSTGSGVALEGCDTTGTTVKAGPDLNRNGELEDGEVRGEASACIHINQAGVLQRAVAEAETCPTGGTLVGMGRDSNGNGVMEEAELLARAYVCLPTLTYEGNYTVTRPADLVALRAVSRIRGHLTITGPTLAELVLPGLVAVEGSLRIDSTQVLKRVELPGVRFVGQALSVNDNPQLETLVVGGNPSEEVPVGTDLVISVNPRLTSLEGLAAVSPRGSVELSFNPALVEPGDLVNVREPRGSVTVHMHGALRTFPMPNLRSVGESLTISNTRMLTSLDSLSQLSHVGKDLSIEDTLEVVSLKVALQSLRTVGGVLEIVSNAKLENLGEMPELTQAGSIHILGNAALQEVLPMARLEVVLKEIRVINNPSLHTVERFPSLRYVKEVALIDNPVLTGVHGFGKVRWLSELTVLRNTALQDLEGFLLLSEVDMLSVAENPRLTALRLVALTDVTTSFSIRDNTRLPTCLAVSLADRVYSGPPDQRIIERNNDQAGCGP